MDSFMARDEREVHSDSMKSVVRTGLNGPQDETAQIGRFDTFIGATARKLELALPVAGAASRRPHHPHHDLAVLSSSREAD